jgi:hypothetical protein
VLHARLRSAERFEYKVVEPREGIMGGKMPGAKLEEGLNEHRREGWQAEVPHRCRSQRRCGAGDVEGVLVTFERPAG